MLLSTDLFSTLRTNIIEGKYERGYKLTEQNLCSTFNVSRTPVREALRQLEIEGLVETIPHRGVFVLGFSQQEIKDMFQLCKPYEVLAVRWAIERATDEELDSLAETFEFMEFYTKKNDVEKMIKINTHFHQIIYAASHNRLLSNMLNLYRQYGAAAKKDKVFGDDYLAPLLEEHREIYNAFKDRDASRGATAMEKHMDKSFERCYNVPK